MAGDGPAARRDVDRGWSWLVMVAVAMNLGSVSIIYYGVGMLQVILQQVFEDSVLTITWILGINTGLLTLPGPIAGVLTNHTSCRTTMLIGSGLFTLGLLGSAFVTKLSHLYITLSFLAGLGYGILYTPSMVVLGFYFDKYFKLATALAAMGTGMGIMLSSPLINFAVDVYGWRGMFFMLAGVGANCFVWSALCHPNSLEKWMMAKRKQATTQLGRQMEHCTLQEDAEAKGDTESNIMENKRLYETKIEQRLARPNHDQIANEDQRGRTNPTKDTKSVWCQILADLRTICCPPMLIFYGSVLLWSISLSAIILHLPNYVVFCGLSKGESALLSTPIGLCNILGRPIAGVMLNRGFVDQFVLYSLPLGVIGVASLGFSFLPVTFPVSMAYSGLVGLCMSGPNVVLCPIVKELVGLRYMAVGFGLEMLICGIGYLLGPPITGLLLESSGDYKWSFIFAGCCSIVCCVMGLLLIMYRKSKASEVEVRTDGSEVKV